MLLPVAYLKETSNEYKLSLADIIPSTYVTSLCMERIICASLSSGSRELGFSQMLTNHTTLFKKSLG